MWLLFAEIDTGVAVLATAVITAIGGVVTGYFLKRDKASASDRRAERADDRKDRKDAYDNLLELWETLKTQGDGQREEITRLQVREMDLRVRLAKLVSFIGFMRALWLKAGLRSEDLPQVPDDAIVPTAEAEYYNRTQQHTTDLLTKRMSDTQRKGDAEARKLKNGGESQ